MVVGVTPRTVRIALRVQPNSATTCALLKDVNDFRVALRMHSYTIQRTTNRM